MVCPIRAGSGAGFFLKATGATFSVANSNEYMLSTNPTNIHTAYPTNKLDNRASAGQG
jgi:hypothetical protein